MSPAYDVFKIIDESQILPEYLMMWFSRSEFDRNAWFYTDTDVRGKLGWDSFCGMELPVPTIEKQQEIVKEYNVVKNRIALNEQLNQNLEETAQALYKHWFVDFEFPVTKESHPELVSGSQPVGYKSAGGKMIYKEELDMEIPEEWELKELSELVSTQYGYTERATEEEVGPKFLRITDIAQDYISWDNVPFCPINNSEFSKYELKRGDIIIARTGATVGYAKQIGKKIPKAVFASYLVRIIPHDPLHQFLLGMNIVSKQYREFILSNAEGSAQPQANAKLMTKFLIRVPDDFILKKFNKLITPYYDFKEISELQNQFLLQLQELLLSKMARMKEEKEMV